MMDTMKLRPTEKLVSFFALIMHIKKGFPILEGLLKI